MKSCSTCDMPLEKDGDIAKKEGDYNFCVHCVGDNGELKSCKEIFDGCVSFFVSNVAKEDKSLAEKLTRKNMNMLPYWEGKGEEVLEGEEASDEEFDFYTSKL